MLRPLRPSSDTTELKILTVYDPFESYLRVNYISKQLLLVNRSVGSNNSQIVNIFSALLSATAATVESPSGKKQLYNI